MSQMLPQDLLLPIFTHIKNSQDLCSLSLTCYAFRDEAQRALFSNCVVPIHPSQHQLRLPFFDAIESSPERLSLHVRKLTIGFCVSKRFQALIVARNNGVDGADIERAGFVAWLEELGTKIGSALRLMRALAHLRVTWDDVTTYRPVWLDSLLNGCTFRLTVLIWDVATADLKQFFKNNLVAQDELGVLLLYPGTESVLSALDPDPEMDSLLRHCCPQLHTVSTSWNIARAMLERRQNITCVSIDTPARIDILSSIISHEALRSVCYFWCSMPISMLEFPIGFLKNVVVLQVQCVFEEEYAKIAALPRLEVLIVTYEQWEMIMDNAKFDAWLRYAFTHSARLTRVYMSGLVCCASDDGYYTCYTYDSAKDQLQWRNAYPDEMNL